MKKKIMVFMLLFVFLVGVLVPAQLPVPVQAANSTETTADDVKYADIEDFMHSAGYSSFVKNEGSLYLVSDTGSYWCVEEIKGVVDYNPFWLYDVSRNSIWYFADVSVNQAMCKYYNYYVPSEASIRDNFDVVNSGSNGYGTSNGVYWNGVSRYYAIDYGNEKNVLYSDLDIYQVEPVTAGTTRYVKNTDNVYFESSVYGNFSFPVWCQYAGLNCIASSNESPTKIPYSYNSYWHIVRRTSSGKWLLTTIGNSKDMKDMQLRLSEDLCKLIIYNVYEDDGTDSAVNGYLAHVRQYEYDTDGWKVRTYDTYDVRDMESDIIELETGTAFDDTRILAFTNTDIHSFNGYAVYYEASTEYYEVTDTPTVTPEPTPDSGSDDSGSSGSDDSGSSGSGSSGSGSSGSSGSTGGVGSIDSTIGGNAKAGGGLDFIVTMLAIFWTKVCSIPMSVDGYEISIQQLYIYGIVSGIVIAIIFAFTRRK